MENRKRINTNKKDLDTVERMVGLEKPNGELKRKGDIPPELKLPTAAAVYEMDGDIAKMKVQNPS